MHSPTRKTRCKSCPVTGEQWCSYMKAQASHQSEPGKDQIEHLVKQLYVYQELACERVRRAVYVVELDYAMYGGEERAVQPPPAL